MLYDITRPLTPRTAVYPGDTPVSITPVMQMRHGDYCNVSSITMSVHAGTHIDAPRHYSDDAPGADKLDLSALIGPARVVTLNGGILNPTGFVNLQGLNGLALLLHTRASDTPDDAFDPTYPFLTPEDANWLGGQGIRLIGMDTPSVDPPDSVTLPAHIVFLRHSVIIVENLCLRGVPDGDYELIALPLKIVDGDAAPARVVLRSK